MSKPYVISYDLNAPGQKYKEITSILRSDEVSISYYKVLETTILLRSNLSASQIVDKIKLKLDPNDKLIICEAEPVNYSGWLSDTEWTWLKENIFY